MKRIEGFYTELYSSSNQVQTPNLIESKEEIPDVSLSEVRSALSQMANDKAEGPDGISIEQLKAGGHLVQKNLAIYIHHKKKRRFLY